MSATPEERRPTLDELEKWAKDPSGENWRNLLRTLTDIFLSDIEEHSGRYGDAYSEVVCRLLDEVAEEVRAELSNRVAPLENFPDKVVLRLAHDESSVARPILEQSPVLTETDLIEIADMMQPEHSQAISRRKELGRKITDVLAKRGDAETIRTMASNPGAQFSDRTYRLVAEKAKTDPQLQESLVERRDMTQAVTVQLMPFLSAELKERLRQLEEPEGGSLLDSLTEITGAAEKKKQDRKVRIEAYASVEQVRAGQATIDQAAEEMARGGKLAALCLYLAGIGHISEQAVSAAFMGPNGTRLAQICKGLKLKPSTFSAIAQLRARKLNTPAAESIKYIDGYERVSAADSEALIKTMQDEAKAARDKAANDKAADAKPAK